MRERDIVRERERDIVELIIYTVEPPLDWLAGGLVGCVADWGWLAGRRVGPNLLQPGLPLSSYEK